MANCLRHFSVHDSVPSSIFACNSFSTRCPSQKYLLQKAKQLSFGVRFRTGAASWVSSPLGSWCFGLRAAMAARDGDRAAGGGLGLLWSVCRGRGGAFPIGFARLHVTEINHSLRRVLSTTRPTAPGPVRPRVYASGTTAAVETVCSGLKVTRAAGGPRCKVHS